MGDLCYNVKHVNSCKRIRTRYLRHTKSNGYRRYHFYDNYKFQKNNKNKPVRIRNKRELENIRKTSDYDDTIINTLPYVTKKIKTPNYRLNKIKYKAVKSYSL